MKYKYFNVGYDADMNTPPNPRTILSIISTITAAANAKDVMIEKMKMIDCAKIAIIALNHIFHRNFKELLLQYYAGMYDEGMKSLEKGFHTPTLDFAYALKAAIDIMSSTGGQYHEAWKKALGDKLTETQALLEQKMEKLKRKQANATRKPSFWDQQPTSPSDEKPSTSQSDCAL